MPLHYLVFDFSDEDSGRGSFDAMASVAPERRAALLDEIAAVMRWSHRTFGPAGALDDDGEWDYELQAVAEPGTPLQIAYEAGRGEVSLSPGPSLGDALTTVTLVLSGSPAFCQAFQDAFGVD
ncbi:hypothetical protein [Ramlibacter sp. Leaf400]|uniref:hypothetical protein n=1 Tax=Ramlibacter sp. Leaf400 TaxID=1736365 RepID=UPI0006F7084B|nr:hypothetical protein [Ramlibacter sp. Leaf400]KQT14177.1 hypothetical protein ASG30_00910 [Ramlibacter sp. Leaf400]